MPDLKYDRWCYLPDAGGPILPLKEASDASVLTLLRDNPAGMEVFVPRCSQEESEGGANPYCHRHGHWLCHQLSHCLHLALYYENTYSKWKIRSKGIFQQWWLWPHSSLLALSPSHPPCFKAIALFISPPHLCPPCSSVLSQVYNITSAAALITHDSFPLLCLSESVIWALQ